jgi:hypothetical protein
MQSYLWVREATITAFHLDSALGSSIRMGTSSRAKVLSACRDTPKRHTIDGLNSGLGTHLRTVCAVSTLHSKRPSLPKIPTFPSSMFAARVPRQECFDVAQPAHSRRWTTARCVDGFASSSRSLSQKDMKLWHELTSDVGVTSALDVISEGDGTI